MRELKIFDRTMLIAAIIMAALLFYLAVFMMGWIIGIEKMASLEKFLSASSGVMIFLLIIAGAAFALSFLVMFVCWLCRDEGMMILPFEVAAGEDKYSGKAISQLLTTELLRISRIHNPEIEYKGITPIESEKLKMPELAPTSENLAYTVSQLGSLSFGTASINIGPLVVILKELWPIGDNGQIIAGSLQKYGSMISLVACLEHKEISAWEMNCEIERNSRNGDEKIPRLIKDLAFKIIHDLRHEEITAETWQGFKHFTESLEFYRQYTHSDDVNYLEQARKECITAAKSEPKYERILGLLYNLGMAYVDKRGYFEAEELFLLANSIKTDYVMALFGLGYSYAVKNKIDTALGYFEKATDIDPKLDIAWYNKGVALDNLGRTKEAIKAYDKAIEVNPKLIPALNNKGLALASLGRTQEAIVAYETVIEIDPLKADAWYNKGIALDNLGRTEEAIKVYDKAIDIDPKFALAWSNKGMALVNMGRAEEAIEAYDKAIELDPELSPVWYNKGLALANLGRMKEAVIAFEKTIEIDPQKANAWFNKGAVYGNLEQHEKALKCFNEIIKINPQDSMAWYNKGLALDKLGQTQEAVKAYDKAIDLDPSLALAWSNKGGALATQGRAKEAIEACEKAIDLDPNLTLAWSNKDRILTNLGLVQESIESYENAAELGMKTATRYIAIARLYRKLGRESESFEACKRARNLIEKESEYNRACFEAVCGSPDAALELLRTALEKTQETADWARQDRDFEFISDDPRFSALLDEFSEDGEKGSE